MSYTETKEALSYLNGELQARYDEGNPLQVKVTGRPDYHIISLYPLVYEKYGFLRNRAPNIAGSLALRGFLIAPHPGGEAFIIAGVEAGNEGYGLIINADNVQTINKISCALGYPGFRLRPS